MVSLLVYYGPAYPLSMLSLFESILKPKAVALPGLVAPLGLLLALI